MKKVFLIGLGAIALMALNVLAFSSSVAVAETTTLPYEFSSCYQTISSCGSYGYGEFKNCTSRRTSSKCYYNYYKCNNCSYGPLEPNDPDQPYDPGRPYIDPRVGPEVPIPADFGNKMDPGAGQYHP